MLCPNCEERGVEIELEPVEGVTHNPTNEFEDVETGMWLECANCGYQDDYVKEDFDEYDEVADRELNSEILAYPELLTI